MLRDDDLTQGARMVPERCSTWYGHNEPVSREWLEGLSFGPRVAKAEGLVGGQGERLLPGDPLRSSRAPESQQVPVTRRRGDGGYRGLMALSSLMQRVDRPTRRTRSPEA
jgi:hypothetical protein